MKTPYLYKEYNGKTFKGWACGLNGTSYHAIFPTKREAVAYNAQFKA
jgi:hypothetical protein